MVGAEGLSSPFWLWKVREGLVRGSPAAGESTKLSLTEPGSQPKLKGIVKQKEDRDWQIGESEHELGSKRNRDCQDRPREGLAGQGCETDKGYSLNLDGQGQDYQTPGGQGHYVWTY